nr:hypothetical protein [Tanacetum cinerariifolium]
MNEEDMFGVNDLDGDEVIVDAIAEDQIAFDEEVARKLEAYMKAEIEEEDMIAMEKDEANIDMQKSKAVYGILREEKEILCKKLKRGTDHPLKLNKEVLFMKRVNIFVDMNTEIVEERLMKTQIEVTEASSKRAKDELEQESAKRQRLEKQDDSAELKRCLEIVSEDDDDVTIKATLLSSKSPTMVDYKIYKEVEVKTAQR